MAKWIVDSFGKKMVVSLEDVVKIIPKQRNGHFVAYSVLGTDYAEGLGHRVIQAVWSETGYYPMQLWIDVGGYDYDKASSEVEKLNEAIGLKPKEAMRIILQSMRPTRGK